MTRYASGGDEAPPMSSLHDGEGNTQGASLQAEQLASPPPRMSPEEMAAPSVNSIQSGHASVAQQPHSMSPQQGRPPEDPPPPYDACVAPSGLPLSDNKESSSWRTLPPNNDAIFGDKGISSLRSPLSTIAISNDEERSPETLQVLAPNANGAHSADAVINAAIYDLLNLAQASQVRYQPARAIAVVASALGPRDGPAATALGRAEARAAPAVGARGSRCGARSASVVGRSEGTEVPERDDKEQNVGPRADFGAAGPATPAASTADCSDSTTKSEDPPDASAKTNERCLVAESPARLPVESAPAPSPERRLSLARDPSVDRDSSAESGPCTESRLPIESGPSVVFGPSEDRGLSNETGPPIESHSTTRTGGDPLSPLPPPDPGASVADATSGPPRESPEEPATGPSAPSASPQRVERTLLEEEEEEEEGESPWKRRAPPPYEAEQSLAQPPLYITEQPRPHHLEPPPPYSPTERLPTERAVDRRPPTHPPRGARREPPPQRPPAARTAGGDSGSCDDDTTACCYCCYCLVLCCEVCLAVQD